MSLLWAWGFYGFIFVGDHFLGVWDLGFGVLWFRGLRFEVLWNAINHQVSNFLRLDRETCSHLSSRGHDFLGLGLRFEGRRL